MILVEVLEEKTLNEWQNFNALFKTFKVVHTLTMREDETLAMIHVLIFSNLLDIFYSIITSCLLEEE